MIRARNLLVAIAAIVLGSSAASATLADRFPLLAFDRTAGCELELAGNGRIVEIRASGMIPGEALAFTLTNGDMQPIVWQVFADGSGRWQKLYLPFRFNREGGTVQASITAARCSLSASLPWTRGVRTIG
jgi:hypothetical protein